MKRLIYILVAFTALLTAACSQTIVFDEINEVVPPVSTTIQDNQIWYTTNSGGTVSPQNMPSVESNIYVNGKGIITFSQKLTAIETRAFEKCENLVTITLPDCIENIAAEAFNECNSLTKINIPKSTSEIGQEAFCKCLSLKSITIPSSVDAIGYCAFEGCHNLATLTFEGGSDASNLTSIDGGAFNNCSALKSLVLPSSLRTLGESAFSNCTSLTTVTLPDDLEFVDGAVFSGCSALKEFKGNNVSADGRCLIHNGVMKGFAPANLTSYTLPDSIEGLCNHLFEDFTTITSITLPSSLRNIGEWCFSGCNGLTSITIPERVDNIEAYAFYSCEKLAAVYAKPTDPPALSTEVFGGSRPSTFKIYVAAKNLEIYKSSWSDYKSYIVVDKNSDPIATDWSVVGSHCDWYTDQGTQMTVSGEYAVANGVTFASDGEFKFVANKSWDINYGVEPGTTVKLGETYQGKAEGDNIKVAAGTYNIKFSIYDATFVIEKGSINPNTVITYTSTDGNVVTPYAADVFGANIVSNTYAGDQGIITFDGDITKIGNSAFKQCNTLQAIIIPQSVTKIDHFAFTDCTNLTAINFPSGVTEIGNLAFNNCQSLESVVLPSSLTKIGTQAFYCCNSISSVTIPQSVTTISDNAFGFCASLAEFKGKFASEDGRCLVVNGTLNSFASAGVTEYTIPSGVTAIGHYAMHNSALLTTVTIPQSVQTVGDGAFNGCISLASVYCKPTTPPTGGSAMFDNNAANRKIYVPAGSVDAYKAADGWKEYADAIFADADPANCQILYTSTDGNVVTPYKTDAFGANIVSNTYEDGQGVITFDSAVTSVGNYAFYKCRNLTSVTIPNGVTLIGNNAFDECSISSIIIPDGVESIGTDAFIYCHNLTEVHIPQNVINLGGNPFRSCNGLAKFSGKYASADGRLLVQNGNIYSFAQAGLVEYTITEPGVNTIGWELFRDCESLVEVTIPQTITKIDFEAFYNCSSLKSVYCRSTTPPILGSKAFGGNATDRKIYVPASSVEAYKSAQYWSDYADAIVAEGGDGILPTFESNEIVGHNVPFAVGDLFYVFNKINHCDEYKYNGNTNEEGKPIIELSNPTYYSSHKTIDKVIIVYNSDKSLSLPVNEGSATSVNVVVKSVQDYVRGSYDIHAAPMISVSDDLGSVLLKNVCGWVKVSLTGNGETVKKIEFSGNNNEELATSSMISSSATISLSDLSVTSVGYAFTKLTMDFDNADEDENWDTATLSTTPTDFYFSMLPTEFTNGFNMKITCTDGTMMTYTTNNSISVSRNEVYQETPFTYAGEPIQLNISDLNSPVFRDLTYSEGYANTFEVKVANNKYQNGFFIFYNPDYQPSGAGDAGTLNGEYEIVTDEIGTKTYTAKTFIADPSRSCVPYDGDLYYFKSGKVTVSGNNASTTIAFDAIVTNSEGGELPLKSQCTLESMGYTTLTNAENLGFSSFVYQASGGYFTMQSTSGQNTMTIELKTTAKTPNELKDKTFTDTALNDYISSGSLRMGDLTSYDTLVGSIIFAVEGLNYTMTTKGLKFIDYTGNIYQIPDGGYSVSLKQGTINSGGGIW